MNATTEAYPPGRCDAQNPALWTGAHWRWLRATTDPIGAAQAVALESMARRRRTWRWDHDKDRGCWDGHSSDGRHACVAKDGTKKEPWGAYFGPDAKANDPPRSLHRTMLEARKACEEGD